MQKSHFVEGRMALKTKDKGGKYNKKDKKKKPNHSAHFNEVFCEDDRRQLSN